MDEEAFVEKELSVQNLSFFCKQPENKPKDTKQLLADIGKQAARIVISEGIKILRRAL